ncbi:MAG: hypothetical protein Q9191_006873 [Dirinaria sp. TL-2023a]
MGSTQSPSTVYGPNLSLTSDERALLRTALASNSPRAPAQSSFDQPAAGEGSKTQTSNGMVNQTPRSTPLNSSTLYTSPEQDGPASGHFEDTSPLGDFELEDGNFDWDNSGDLFGDLPALPDGDNAEHHDKRKKSSDDDGGDEEGSGKRRESGEKSGRKPGRKPITGEPTTKRKAQNRAAQRAFRERKERHLKDLETKVEDLEKASEATNHENGRLRAEVERLNTEVKEYRHRMSLTAPAVGRSPPTTSPASYNSYQSNNNDFMFAFPNFGGLPGAGLPGNFMSNGSRSQISPPARQTSQSGRSPNSTLQQSARASSSQSPTAGSPKNPNNRGSPMNLNRASPTNLNVVSAPTTQSSGPYQSPNSAFSGNGLEELNGLFSPSILETARRSGSEDYNFPSSTASVNTGPRKSSSTDSYRALANIPSVGHNGSTSSPSASSMSHGGGLDSSCGTTPEASADSPEYRKPSEGALNTINEEIATHVPKYNAAQRPAVVKSPANDFNGIDFLAQQNGGQFDPVLFGDYRDSQDNIVNGSFGDFFNEAYLTQDFSQPYNTGDIFTEPRPAQSAVNAVKEGAIDPIKQCDVAQNANDDPTEVANPKPKQFLTCDKLWERVHSSDKVTSGAVEMDDLCSQLKAKAKCSGKGAVIDQDDVDRILGPPKTEQQKDFFSMFS